MSKIAYVYALDTLADWELGLLQVELNSGQFFKEKGSNIPVKVVAASKEQITTKGGMRVVPDLTPDEIDIESTAVLLLPGADTWQEEKHLPILDKAKELLDAGALVAAICGGTAALAGVGLLNDRPHTSNAPSYLTMVGDAYTGKEYYRDEPVVVDKNLITASSAASLELARAVLEKLDVYKPETLDAWYSYFKTADADYFFRVMDSLKDEKR